MEHIPALIKQCGLGTVTGELLPVSGGLMHKMYKVPASSGCYAVKCLNPEIMKRPQAMENYREAERLESILKEHGLSVVAALSFDGKKMIELDGGYYYVFPWLDGEIADPAMISEEQCRIAGGILGRIHAIDSSSAAPVEETTDPVNFGTYLRLAKEKKSPIAELLGAERPLLEKAQEELSEARGKLPAIRAISNDDMDPKNIMWNEGKAYVIDLECLGYSNPVSSCLDLALQWAGTVNGNFRKEKLAAFFQGYLKAYDNGFRAYDELFGISYTWIEWLEYNLKRALGTEGSDAGEIRLGETETENTIKRIKYLASLEEEIRSVLKELRMARS
ncbi:MAG: aminoglycoside phosphotransferase family protein [Lachnospiraceae bacterium]|nr:aminoglycoside phosphotransferase family protein [Lachnospiraceae bacterium]